MFENPLVLFLAHIYETLIRWSSNLQSLFLLYFRLAWGSQFFLEGLAKLHHMDVTIDFFTNHGIPYAALYAPMVARTEIIGGILLILGLASRVAAFPLILIMFTALKASHTETLSLFSFIKDPLLFAQESTFPYLVVTLLIFAFGPGRVSLDAWIKRWFKQSQGLF